MPFAAEQQRRKVPVTIITGFLGAGKTSLVNYILKEKHGKRLAVVENEFGEINIDRELVSENLLEKEDLVSLQNGCVCCSLRKDIVKAFAEIEKRSNEHGHKVDAILLETTGLADPGPVAFTFFANPWVASRFKLDSIICVVDARYLTQHLGDLKGEGAVNEAVQQLAFSDLIVLNKIDLVSEAQKAEALRVIRSINDTARLVECQLNDTAHQPPLEKLLGVNSFSVNRALEVDSRFLECGSEDEDELAMQVPPQYSPIRHAEGGVDGGAAVSCGLVVHSPDSGGEGQEQHAGSRAQIEQQEQQQRQQEHAGEKHAREECSSGPASKRRSCEDGSALAEYILNKGERQSKRPRTKKLHDLSNVTSVAVTATGLLDDYRFNMFMRDLLSEKAKDIFRCKGVLAVHGQGDKKFIFQGVHETICYGPADKPWQEGEARVNKIVFIGKGLDRKALIEGFKTCVRAM